PSPFNGLRNPDVPADLAGRETAGKCVHEWGRFGSARDTPQRWRSSSRVGGPAAVRVAVFGLKFLVATCAGERGPFPVVEALLDGVLLVSVRMGAGRTEGVAVRCLVEPAVAAGPGECGQLPVVLLAE